MLSDSFITFSFLQLEFEPGLLDTIIRLAIIGQNNSDWTENRV